MRWGAIVVLCLVGCVESSSVFCERVCPAGTVCTSTGCASPQQVSECLDKAEGDPCSYASTQGICVEGVCQEQP